MTTRTLLFLSCTLALAGAPSAAGAAELASNDVELPIDAVVLGAGAGESIQLAGAVRVRAEVSTAAGGTTLATECEARGAGTGSTGARYALASAAAGQQVAVPAALPSDAVLVCPATLHDASSGTPRPVRFRVRVTVHADGRATFALAGVEEP